MDPAKRGGGLLSHPRNKAPPILPRTDSAGGYMRLEFSEPCVCNVHSISSADWGWHGGGVVFISDRPVLSSLTFAQYEEKEETGGCTDGLEGVLDPIRLELISGSFRLL